ncbi:MAG: S46 family peptidase [Bacteroidia bacterium]|nr:S46 family peptidase [Bacteroidia bacterium]
MNRFFSRFAQVFSATSLLIVGLSQISFKPEEGMFPLNYLNINDLKNAGIKLEADQIFNPSGVSLTDALVRVGGCTGSFISEEGLIITNHHCVYGNVARLSNKDHNYLEDGFVAGDKSAELPVSMPCRITQSYEDVSDEVLKGLDENTDAKTRLMTIAANIKTITEREQKANPELDIEVSEMFVGKSYTLFRYVLLKDVRLVMAPPLTVGQFGGDSDNWEWPRHNGDFSLVRAYVGKDGKPAPYNKDNIPYKPKNTLKINPNGTKEGDFVFIMGYPGRTFRHESGSYLKFQQEVQLPVIQQFYKQYIDWMKEYSDGDVNKRLAFAGTIQGMENTEKNYRGKIQGLRRTDVVAQRLSQDAQLKSIYNAETQPREYEFAKTTMAEIEKSWALKTQIGKLYLYSTFLDNQSKIGHIGNVLLRIQNEKTQPLNSEIMADAEKSLKVIDWKMEQHVVESILDDLYKIVCLSGKSSFKYGNQQGLNADGKKLLHKSLFMGSKSPEAILAEWKKSPQKFNYKKDALLLILAELQADINNAKLVWSNTGLELTKLMPRYISLREKLLQSQFIPDANSTLRLTYGYIRSYSPNDGEHHSPYTSLDGIFEKANTSNDYRLPQMVADKLRKENIPQIFKDPKTGKVVVGILYNMDTTGGNSGSPVLNDRGELIGINFDRSFTATINDFAWNEKYSRSIGCDIRYVIYVLKYVSEADHILKELNISL